MRTRCNPLPVLALAAVFVATFLAGSPARAQSTPVPNPCVVVGSTPVPTVVTMAGTSMAGMGQEFDLMFIDMMIPHHQGAVVMSQIALQRAVREEVRDLAQQIIDAQTAEIAQMQAWREAWYPGVAAMPMGQMTEVMSGMMAEMPGMMMATPGGMMGQGQPGGMGMMGQMATMDIQTQIEALCTAGENFDVVFLEQMIPHHQTAMQMALVAQSRATHQEAIDLAGLIIASQQAEVAQMQTWLEES